LAQGGGVP